MKKNKKTIIIAFAILLFFLFICAIVLAIFFFTRNDADTNQNNSNNEELAEEPDTCDLAYTEILQEVEADYSECQIKEVDVSACSDLETAVTQDEQLAIELILDSSGSMSAQVSGEKKMDVAKEVMTSFLNTIPEDVLVGLRVYGHKGSNSEADKALSCANSELIYPIQSPDKAKFASAIDSFDANGWTPIADSLEQAAADLQELNLDNSVQVVYLVSDGQDTCGGDPAATVQALKDQGIEAVINVVGFAVDDTSRAQLQAIANISGGKYFDAQTASQLRNVFDKSIEEIRAEAQYQLCVKREEQQYRLANTREFQQYELCVERNAARENLDAQSLISKNTELDDPCKSELRDRFDAREDYLREQAEDRTDLEQILEESNARQSAAEELVSN